MRFARRAESSVIEEPPVCSISRARRVRSRIYTCSADSSVQELADSRRGGARDGGESPLHGTRRESRGCNVHEDGARVHVYVILSTIV